MKLNILFLLCTTIDRILPFLQIQLSLMDFVTKFKTRSTLQMGRGYVAPQQTIIRRYYNHQNLRTLFSP